MKLRHKRMAIAAGVLVRRGRRRRAGAQCLPEQSGVFLLADAGRRKGSAHRPHLPDRRPGRGRQREARRRGGAASSSPTPPRSVPVRLPGHPARPVQGRQRRRGPGADEGRCVSWRARCWPSTMKTTCRPRPPRRSSRRRPVNGKVAASVVVEKKPMIPEIGHFLLWLALGVASSWARCRWWVPRAATATWMATGAAERLRFACPREPVLCVSCSFVCRARLFGAQCGDEFEHRRCRLQYRIAAVLGQP